jgi:hypothetical protein
MSVNQPTDVESIPADLDRFLGAFFSKSGWRSKIKYDPAENRLYLEVHIVRRKLSGDDRFLSLVEYFTRAQDAVLRQRSGLPLQSRLFATDGSELTSQLHARGSKYLDDSDRSTGMRRRLAWLSFRRRFLVRILPGAALWAGALFFVVSIVGLDFKIAIAVALVALAIQAIVISATIPRPR